MPTFELPSLPPPAAILADDLVELRLIRVLADDDRDLREPAAQFLASATECRFAIHLSSTGERAGRIHLRLTHDPTIVRALGHSGYETEEAHRRRGYATRALRLIRGLARHYGIGPLWVLVAPSNVPSRRAAEAAGFTLYDVAPASAEARAMGLEPELCRYFTSLP